MDSTLAFFFESPWLDHGAHKESSRIYQSHSKSKTLINTLTMDTAVDAAVIRTLGKRLKSRWSIEFFPVKIKRVPTEFFCLVQGSVSVF